MYGYRLSQTANSREAKNSAIILIALQKVHDCNICILYDDINIKYLKFGDKKFYGKTQALKTK